MANTTQTKTYTEENDPELQAARREIEAWMRKDAKAEADRRALGRRFRRPRPDGLTSVEVKEMRRMGVSV